MDRCDHPRLRPAGHFWSVRLRTVLSYGQSEPAAPPPHDLRPGRCAGIDPWTRRRCQTRNQHPSTFARWTMEPTRRKARLPAHPAGHHTVPDRVPHPPPKTRDCGAPHTDRRYADFSPANPAVSRRAKTPSACFSKHQAMIRGTTRRPAWSRRAKSTVR